jgi:hypothetical protein
MFSVKYFFYDVDIFGLSYGQFHTCLVAFLPKHDRGFQENSSSPFCVNYALPELRVFKSGLLCQASISLLPSEWEKERKNERSGLHRLVGYQQNAEFPVWQPRGRGSHLSVPLLGSAVGSPSCR